MVTPAGASLLCPDRLDRPEWLLGAGRKGVEGHGADRLATGTAEEDESSGEDAHHAVGAPDRQVRGCPVDLAFSRRHRLCESGPVPVAVLARDDQIQALAFSLCLG